MSSQEHQSEQPVQSSEKNQQKENLDKVPLKVVGLGNISKYEAEQIQSFKDKHPDSALAKSGIAQQAQSVADRNLNKQIELQKIKQNQPGFEKHPKGSNF